ncbi:BLUF domain-containing protein [Pontibacter oryzae]|uniref:BLUF domain-containing protein n=1 Tax=Pontibacter oryzae TaxID=2304593 RepID=A0A399RQQ2_9BACT|nr:BLUF domain-containing protein [Pontibacter oryzae]RIJ34036.1 BLUF domain-containing protein [Pontibacter oryzae]
MLYYLVYKSEAVSGITAADLESILQVSLCHNKRDDLTGLLLFIEGTFMQLLEGREGAVKDTMQRILVDTRHRHIEILTQAPLQQRNFPDWSMGLRSITFTELSKKTGFRDLDSSLFLNVHIGNSSHPALQILKAFYEPEVSDY